MIQRVLLKTPYLTKEPSISLLMPRRRNSNIYCIICKHKNCLVIVSKVVQAETSVKTRIYYSSGEQCCKNLDMVSIFH